MDLLINHTQPTSPPTNQPTDLAISPAVNQSITFNQPTCGIAGAPAVGGVGPCNPEAESGIPVNRYSTALK